MNQPALSIAVRTVLGVYVYSTVSKRGPSGYVVPFVLVSKMVVYFVLGYVSIRLSLN